MAPRGTANSRGEQVPSRWRKLLGDVVGQGNTVRARSAKGFPGPKPEESYNWMLGLQRVPISGVIRAHEEQFEWLEQPMQRPPAIDWQHRPLPNSPVRVVRYLSDWEPQPPLGVRHATKGRQPRSDLGTIHGQGDQVRARSDFGVPSEEESGVPGDEEVTHRPDVRRERDHIDKASDGDEDRGSQERSRVLEEGPSLPHNKEEATLAKASEESERPTTGTEASVPSPVPKPAAPRSPRTPRTPRPKPTIDPTLPRELGMLVAAFDCCEKDNEEHKKQREELYASFDGNANGLISLNETGSGVLQRLSNLYGKEAMPLYKRYYRSFIRAFMDARDASPPSGRPDDAQFVCKSEFRLLLVYLRVYATWHEVFRLVDCARTRGGSKLNYLDVEVPEGDYRISRDEWLQALPKVRVAALSWAPFIALRAASAADFDEMDVNGGGHVDLQEFCEWVERAEKLAATPIGVELGVNEPLDRAAITPRQWHTAPCETLARLKAEGGSGGTAACKSPLKPEAKLGAYDMRPTKRAADLPLNRAEMAARAEVAIKGVRRPGPTSARSAVTAMTSSGPVRPAAAAPAPARLRTAQPIAQTTAELSRLEAGNARLASLISSDCLPHQL